MATDTLLKSPAPLTCTSQDINFTEAGLPEYARSFAIAIEHLITPDECTALLAAVESTTDGQWEQAMVNIGGGKQKIMTDIRSCGRIIWDNAELASRIQDRIMPHLPKDMLTLADKPRITGRGPAKRGETWHLTRLNERLRFLKYRPGDYFREHCDGSYVTPEGDEMSFLTVHLYLNGNPLPSKNAVIATGNQNGRERATSSQDLEKVAAEAVTTITCGDPAEEQQEQRDSLDLVGGATRFFSLLGDKYFDITPTSGSCIVFQHRDLLHSGEDVFQGTKYTLRTDIMYKRASKAV